MQSRRTAITQTAERPVRRRRGGSAVEVAISDAVIAELAEVGFGRLTFEGVAERAGTGKSPLYRRWPDTTSLVIDTLEKLGSDPAKYVRTGLLRDDLIGLTVHMIKTQKGVKGDAYRSLLGEAHRYPQLLARFKSQVLAPTPGTLGVSCFPGFYGRGVLCVLWSLFSFGVRSWFSSACRGGLARGSTGRGSSSFLTGAFRPRARRIRVRTR